MPVAEDQWSVVKTEPLPKAQAAGDPWSVVKSEPVKSSSVGLSESFTKAIDPNKPAQKLPTLDPEPRSLKGKAWDWIRDLPTGIPGAKSTFGKMFDENADDIGRMWAHTKKDIEQPILPHVVGALEAFDDKFGPKQQTPEEHKKYLMSQGLSEADAEKFKHMAPADPLRVAIDAYKSADPEKIAEIKDRSLTVGNVLRGMSGGGRQVADGLSTIENGSLIFVLTEETVPRAVKMLANAKFALDQAGAAVEGFKKGYDAAKKGDAITAAQEWTAAPVDTLFAFLTGKHLGGEVYDVGADLSKKLITVDEEAVERERQAQRSSAGGWQVVDTHPDTGLPVLAHPDTVKAGWNPNAASRALWGTQQYQRVQAGRAARPQARQDSAETRTQRVQTAKDIADKREDVHTRRTEAQAEPTEGPTRAVDSQVDDTGHISYRGTVWGEDNSFGVTSNGDGHAVYRKTPRGVEWLDQDGNFTDSPASLYFNPDQQAADTVARLSSLTATADTLAEQEGATEEQKQEAAGLAETRRALVGGEIDARDAQKRAGIAEAAKLSDEFLAARDGKLNGPYYESGPQAFYDELERQARDRIMDMPEEAIQNILDKSSEFAREQTENNLHHVYRPGDYIVSKRGVKWTLDSKGMLHPDDGGAPVPLMKKGVYSNQVMEMAASGRVGYGDGKSRTERRSDRARQREVQQAVRDRQEEVRREMVLAKQREGLETAPETLPRADEGEKAPRRQQFIARPPAAPDVAAVRQLGRMLYKAPAGPESVIQAIARTKGVSPEEVMRQALASDPERANTVEAKIARLEVGDEVSDRFRPDRPWKVEEQNGKLVLRSGQANPLPLDRLNPSDRVKQIVERGEIKADEFKEGDTERAAFDKPHIVFQRELAAQVKERMEGKVKDPQPKTPKQAKVQAQAAQRRSVAAQAEATRAVIDALDPITQSVEKAEEDAEKANETVKVAEEGYAQAVETQGKTEPEDTFPQRAPASIGRRGEAGVITQNNRDFPFHYELLPIDGVQTSHQWQGSNLIINPEYPESLQPRTISEDEARQNALRAEPGTYDFRQYADKTINGTMGPVIVDEGGRAVGGNTRLAIMRRFLQNLESGKDPEERENATIGFRSAMRKLALESGIPDYPDDGQTYVVVRMLDEPIKTTREAADLGRLFNKSVGVQITKSAKGISYSKSFTEPMLEDIGRRVEANDGVIAAMEADPEYFRQIVIDQFGILPEEYADWFRNDPSRGQVLNDAGRDQFVKALLGTVVRDTSVLNRIEGKTPYRALERALSYVLKMKALPDRDITGKVLEALAASAETMNTDPALHTSKDKWKATYNPQQQELAGLETDTPPEPDRMVEAIWRALHASDAAVPRVFNDRLEAFIGEETSKGGWIFGEKVETPAEAFNRAFERQLREVAQSRGDKKETITQDEFDAALRNREFSDQERNEAETKPKEEPVSETPIEVKPETKGKIERPPAAPTPAVIADRKLSSEKAEQGYVTPQQLREFLSTHPATAEHAPELMRTAQMMAEYVYDADPPVGVDRKEALDWVLRERLARIEAGELKSKRGQYADPTLEKGLGEKILKLHKAADATTFIHEFAHIVFPFLSDEDLKAIDSIGDKRVWDGNSASLKEGIYRDLSEKFAHGMERFLRDQNPRDFNAEVGKVLAKIKDIFRKVYLAFKGDPLSPYTLTSDSVEMFDKMFHIEGSDVPTEWRDEVKKARAAEKKLVKPDEAPHPVVKMARELGASGLRESIDGKVEDSTGDRVDPKKPTAVTVYPSMEAAVMAFADMGTEGSKIKGAELIQGKDGEWATKFNTSLKVPKNVLFQEMPERHPGVVLEDLERRLKATPTFKLMERKLLELQIANMRNKIRAEAGVEPLKPQSVPELPKQVLEEKRNADRIRKESHGVPGVQRPQATGRISQPPKLGMPGHAGAGQRGGVGGKPLAGVPSSLADVKPVNVLPLTGQRGEPVGTVRGERFDAKAWVEGLKRAGLPETAPPPTVALSPQVAEKLKFPGQKQVVQLALTALEQGDGFVIATGTGSGKSFTGCAIIKEFREQNPNARILYITKNATLKAKTKGIAANTFGFEMETEKPKDIAQTGTWTVSYAGMMSDAIYKQMKWDLVLADESGEARNWFREENKQGKLLKEVLDNTRKAVYMSATPFHCLAPGTSVLMHNGTVKPVEEVCVGDLVMGPDSQPRLVRKLSHGFGQMYEVIPKKGDSYKVNENHILSLRMAGRTIPFDGVCGKRYVGWRTHPPDSVVNVSVRDYLKMSPGGLRSRLLGYRADVDFPAQSVPIDPYWLGLWLGDGSCRAASICVAEIDPEIQQYIQGYAERLELVVTQENCKSPAAKQWRISRGKRGFAKGSNRIVPPNPLTALLRGLGLLGKDSINKHIPDVYKANSRDVRLRLLAGMIDSDGAYTKMHLSVSTKSKRLADDIAFIARSLGFAAYLKPVFYALSKFPDVPNWIVRLSGDLDSIPVLLPRKKCPKRKVLIPSQNQAMPASRNAKDVLKVGIRVEPCGVGEFYGFELDGDQLFVLGDFTVTHNSPMEYGYLDKLNLWPKGGFDKWIEQNFAHEKIGDKVVARLDPSKQAKLRQQLIERGQLVSQAISYDGFNAHFGVVPVTDAMKRGLDRIREGFARARSELVRNGKKGMAEKAAAFEATYTKAFLERERLPQAIELARKARAEGWQVIIFSEHSAEDLFRRPRGDGIDPSAYQELDDAMGGQLSKIIPPFPDAYQELRQAFGTQIGDYSGRGNTMAERKKALSDFQNGQTPVLYSTYAAGGIGVDMHDADFPDQNIKGGDKPRIAIFLGPPYSGVLLEQAMGRTWRFGVKSDTHSVFLATDSEPDVRLMTQKVGPRMRALRAAVLGERDSLASAMADYTDEEKVRARQDSLAYAEGDEQKVNATSFQVRSKSRNVGIQDWSAIQFPSAELAKNKGMKYGEEVKGGDWSNLYQNKFGLFEPDSSENAAGKKVIDNIANAVASGRDVPPSLQNLDPAERDTVVGLSAAIATGEVDLPVERDKEAVARQSMESGLRNIPSLPYYGITMSQEIGMENIARRDGKPQVGANLKRMNRIYRADYDVLRSQYWNTLDDIYARNGLKPEDTKELSYVLEGKRSTDNPRIAKAAADVSDMMRLAHQDLSKAGVRVTVKGGRTINYSDFEEDPHYFPHRIDWDHEVTDQNTGKKYTLAETMKAKFDEEARKRILASIPELKPYTYQQIFDYLNRHDPRAPVLSHIHRAREINFPYIKRDYSTLIGYFDQAAEATAQARHFGPELEKLNGEIRKIGNINGRATLQSMFRSTLEPQNWHDVTAKIYNAAIAYEAVTKMTFSAVKVPFHLGLVPLGMEGRVMPLAKATRNFILHPKDTMENAAYVGTITRQLNAADMMYGERMNTPVRTILRRELFEAAYKVVKTISGESARVYLEQYAMNDLKRGGTAAEHTRRLIRDTFLMNDHAIDEAVANGRFTQEDLGRAQTAFANLTTFSDDPLQMPQIARMEMPRGASLAEIGLKRAVRLTYALQSFTLKATSLLRERLYDEVFIHHNYRPLAYAIVASPIIGQMLQFSSAGTKHVVHRGLEGALGKKHKKDSWDEKIVELESTFHDPSAVKLLKFIVDGYTLGYGWDSVRTISAPLFDFASGNMKKAGSEFKYIGPDLVEHMIGPFFDDVWKTLEEADTIGQIESGTKHQNQKPEKVKKSITKYLVGQVPALRNIPQVEDEINRKVY